MRTRRGRLAVIVSVTMLLELGSCGEAETNTHTWKLDLSDAVAWPAMTLVSREGMAMLEIDDDAVRFGGVPFEGTVTLIESLANLHTSGDITIKETVAGRSVSMVYDSARETMEIAVGTLRFTLVRSGEEVEFDGRRASLVDGAKQVVFAADGTVEVTDRE